MIETKEVVYASTIKIDTGTKSGVEFHKMGRLLRELKGNVLLEFRSVPKQMEISVTHFGTTIKSQLPFEEFKVTIEEEADFVYRCTVERHSPPSEEIGVVE